MWFQLPARRSDESTFAVHLGWNAHCGRARRTHPSSAALVSIASISRMGTAVCLGHGFASVVRRVVVDAVASMAKRRNGFAMATSGWPGAAGVGGTAGSAVGVDVDGDRSPRYVVQLEFDMDASCSDLAWHLTMGFWRSTSKRAKNTGCFAVVVSFIGELYSTIRIFS